MATQCSGWLSSSVSFGRTSMPQVSLQMVATSQKEFSRLELAVRICDFPRARQQSATMVLFFTNPGSLVAKGIS
jgi:hypothetical protein